MTKTQSTIQVRLDQKTKRQAKKTLNKMGFDMSSAVKVFLRNVVITQSIPFEIRTENGFTPTQEKQITKESKAAIKKSKGFLTAEELHGNILNKKD